jgi:putative transposase
VSERRGCSALGVERSSVRYISHGPDQAPLVMRIRDLAATRTRYCYFRIYNLLRREGWSPTTNAFIHCIGMID